GSYLRDDPGYRIESLGAELKDELPARSGGGNRLTGAARIEGHRRAIRAAGQALQVVHFRRPAGMARERHLEPGQKRVIAHAMRPRAWRRYSLALALLPKPNITCATRRI